MSQAGDAGFTLLELLVALSVMALLAALAAPIVGRGFTGPAIETAANGLVADLRRLRQEAINRRNAAALDIDIEKRSYRTSSDARVRAFAPELAISALAPGQRAPTHMFTVTFFGDGSATGGSIVLAVGERRRQVVIDRISGRVSVQ